MREGDLNRRFDDEQVKLILKRAAELQHTAGGPAAEEGSGLSATDLELAALEAGIDPVYVQRAISEVTVRQAPRPADRYRGGPAEIDVQATVAGELSLEGIGLLVEEVQRTLDDVGQTHITGRSLTWKSSKPFEEKRMTSVTVTITPGGGVTTLRIREHLGGLAGALFGGLMGGIGGGGLGLSMGLGLGALGSVLAAVGGVALFVGGSYFLARAIYAAKAAERRRQLGDLLERLSERSRHALAAGGRAGQVPPRT